MSIGIRRKESEFSGICLFLVTHLNHELTRAAYELRVWVSACAQLKTLSSLLKLFTVSHCLIARTSNACVINFLIASLFFSLD